MFGVIGLAVLSCLGPLNSPCQEVGLICPFVVIDPTDLGATTAIARNLLQDLCLTISHLMQLTKQSVLPVSRHIAA